jgi:NAD(P)-dependent dehydrogenase (short-subunit alcohol dehydrogenase family)
MNASNLKGKTLFITGASRGIGKAIALRFLQCFSVFLIGENFTFDKFQNFILN